MERYDKYQMVNREALAKHIDNTFGDVSTPLVVKEIRAFAAIEALPIPETGIGDVSDGYHTFNELYHHRAVLFAVICNSHPDLSWKSRLHDTGDMYAGMFIVGIETPKGQATYHYDIEPYWDMFKVKTIDRAPKWDGHTPAQAIERIASLRLLSNEMCNSCACKKVCNSELYSFEDCGNYIPIKEKEKEAGWEIWAGWTSNHDHRIENAKCTECGYTCGSVFHNITELPKKCVGCGAKIVFIKERR